MITYALALLGLMMCYNTTNMTTEILDYPNESQQTILSSEEKDRVKDIGLVIYGLTVEDRGLYLCATPDLN